MAAEKRLDIARLRKIAGGKPKTSNMRSVLLALGEYGPQFGLDHPHRLAQFLAQMCHESAGFRYDRELWGPTAAQKRYDIRTDLGNTKARDGDGSKYRGRTAIQITGKANYSEFRTWCRKHISRDAPDFVVDPDKANIDPWEGLGPMWYWETRKLNRYADRNDIEMVTRRINGGLNGFADRLRFYTRAALVLMGYDPKDVTGFQQIAKSRGTYKGLIDGAAGPQTRAALHMMLAEQSPVTTTASPVVDEVEKEKPVLPDAVERSVRQKTGLWGWLATIFSGGGAGLASLAGLNWQTVLSIGATGLMLLIVVLVLRQQIVNAIREVKLAVESIP